MTTRLRPLLACLLALVIAVTGLQAAAARGQPAPVGTAELCIGLTVVTVHLDRDGNPVEQRHLCPEGAFALFAAAAVHEVLIAPQPAWLRWTAQATPHHAVGRPGPKAQARGPPVTA